MLFLLTGDIQVGKTRWLMGLIESLHACGVRCTGVVAPGVWETQIDDQTQEETYVKIGIDNMLLPGGERFSFARLEPGIQPDWTDLSASRVVRPDSVWEFDADAVRRVNDHFSLLAKQIQEEASASLDNEGTDQGLYIVDEIGKLELLRGEGITYGVDLLKRGPQGRYRNAIVVVRQSLLPMAQELLKDAWGDAIVIEPNSASEALVKQSFGII